MTVVVKITHQRHINIHAIELLSNSRNSRCRLGCVDGNTNHFGSRAREFLNLYGSRNDIGRIGIRHGLNHDGRITTNHNFV